MKILFLFLNRYLANGIPTGISTLGSVLKSAGHQVEVFDTTFIKTEKHSRSARKIAQYKPTTHTLEDLVADDPVQTVEEAFRRKLYDFEPDILCLSVMTGFFDKAVDLLSRVRPECPVVAGGVHPTISPEDVLSFDCIDYVCVGEGEGLLLDLCRHIEAGTDFTHLDNLAYRKGGEVRFNGLRPFIDMNELPPPDWGLFDERHLFRPFVGEIYNGSFYVMSRGCPQSCSYCVNRSLRESMKGCGNYFRYQSPETTESQLRHLKEKHDATWFKFADDSLGLFNLKYLTELSERLAPLDIMFGCSIRPETLTWEKVELLKKMGCVAASVGVESGNPELRRKVLNRRMTNEQIENSIRMLNEADIRVSTFNMIGLPGETREDVMETIRLNRKVGVEAANVYIIYPYPGTPISQKLDLKFRGEDGKIIPVSEASGFHLSKMAPAEVESLLLNFNTYLSSDESQWEEIKKKEMAELGMRNSQ